MDQPRSNNISGVLKWGIVLCAIAGVIWFWTRDKKPDEIPAVQRIVDLAGKKDKAGLLAATKDSNPQAAARAIEEYTRLNPSAVLADVAPLLKDPRTEVRIAATNAFIDAGDAEHVAPLRDAVVGDPDRDVRGSAARAIGQLRAFDGMPTLIRGLDDPELYVRQCSIQAVQKILGVQYQKYHPDGTREERLAVISAIRAEYPKFEKTVRKDVAKLNGRQP